MNKYTLLFCASIGSFAVQVCADVVKIDMKPGLWESNFKFSGESAEQMQMLQTDQVKKAMEEMKKQMANMPPEQRKMISDMMEQQGITATDKEIGFANQNVQVSAEGTVIKQCITQEEIDKGDLSNLQSDCVLTVKQLTKNHITTNYVCAGATPTSGDSDITFASNKQYSGTSRLTTAVGGKSKVVNGTLTGKWLSSNCGEIKPAK